MHFRPFFYGLFLLATIATTGCFWHHHHCCYESAAPEVRPGAPATIYLPPSAPVPTAPAPYIPSR
jgi:hypothetical protein